MLILLRHGRTAANAQHLLQGHADWPLDEVGERQARAAVQAVGRVDRVISSPLQRARQTAALFGTPIEVDDRWIEMDFGVFDRRPLDDVEREVGGSWYGNPEFTIPGGESTMDVVKRVWPACEELMEAATEQDVAVVSHVAPIKAAVGWALGNFTEMSFRSHLSVASVCRITMTRNGPVLLSFNETQHVPLE